MNLLAFELSTEGCSVALWQGGRVLERFEVAPRRHAELALPWADALLTEAGMARSALDAIAVGRGPGAFTGVRLAMAIGQGIALALDRPMVPVSTLAALAMQARDGQVMASIDARMGEVYVGTFAVGNGDASSLGGEAVLAPDAVAMPALAGDWAGVGTGFAAGDGVLQRRLGHGFSYLDPSVLPRAADVARLAAKAFARGEAVLPELAEPAYLRNNVALTIAEQQALKRGR